MMLFAIELPIELVWHNQDRRHKSMNFSDVFMRKGFKIPVPVKAPALSLH